jgi:hypothetical protein
MVAPALAFIDAVVPPSVRDERDLRDGRAAVSAAVSPVSGNRCVHGHGHGALPVARRMSTL